MRAAGLEEDREVIIAQRFHQRQRVFLEERLAPGDLDERQFANRILNVKGAGNWLKAFREQLDLSNDRGQRLFSALGKSISRITIRTAQVAGSQPDEDARQAGEGAFTLQAQVDFVDDQIFHSAKCSRGNGTLVSLFRSHGTYQQLTVSKVKDALAGRLSERTRKSVAADVSRRTF